MRRTQQMALYAAEDSVADRGRVFGSEAELRDWVEAAVSDLWWLERFPEVQLVEVFSETRFAGTGSVGAWYADTRSATIEMAPQHRTARDACHELAHVCSESEGGAMAHDPHFAATYLELVRHLVGFQCYAELRAAFDEFGIEVERA